MPVHTIAAKITNFNPTLMDLINLTIVRDNDRGLNRDIGKMIGLKDLVTTAIIPCFFYRIDRFFLSKLNLSSFTKNIYSRAR